MSHRSLVGQRLVALSMLGWAAFNYPFLTLLEDAGDMLGVPASYMYVFGIWALLIVLMGWVAEHGIRQRTTQEDRLRHRASVDNTGQ